MLTDAAPMLPVRWTIGVIRSGSIPRAPTKPMSMGPFG